MKNHTDVVRGSIFSAFGAIAFIIAWISGVLLTFEANKPNHKNPQPKPVKLDGALRSKTLSDKGIYLRRFLLCAISVSLFFIILGFFSPI